MTSDELRAVLDARTPGEWEAHSSRVRARDDRGPFTVVNTTDLDGTGADAHGIAALRNHAEALIELWRASVALRDADIIIGRGDWSVSQQFAAALDALDAIGEEATRR